MLSGPVIPWHSVYFRKAADVPVMQSVLILSANFCPTGATNERQVQLFPDIRVYVAIGGPQPMSVIQWDLATTSKMEGS